MFYFYLSLLLLAVHTFLVFTTNFSLHPEFSLFPYLVQKGLMPYRDFFDHHGFLTYYILAPLSFDTSFFSYKLFYYLIQSVNLILVLKVLQTSRSKTVYTILGLLYVLINYYFGENHFWYETLITACYLSVYLLLNSKNRWFKAAASGIILAISSLIKPTAAFIILPLVLVYKNKNILYSFLAFWVLVVLFFYFQRALSQFYENLFLFNLYLGKFYRSTFFSDQKLLVSSAFLILFALFICWKNKNFYQVIKPLVFFISSLAFLLTGYNRGHLLPAATFMVLILKFGLDKAKQGERTVYFVLILIFSTLILRKVFYHHQYLNAKRVSWQTVGLQKDLTLYLKGRNIMNKNIYLFSNHGEIYISLNLLPPVYYPLNLPLTSEYFPDYQQQIIAQLQKNNVKYILIHKKEAQFDKLIILRQYIVENYRREKEFEDFILMSN